MLAVETSSRLMVFFALFIALSGFATGMILGLSLHEFGHAAAAGILRCGPRTINIGRGPILLRYRLSGVWLVIRLFPTAGHVEHLPQSFYRRTSVGVVIAAGPAVNLMLMFASVAVGITCISTNSLLESEFALGLAVAQAILVISTLIPRVYRVGKDARSRYSDGWRLWRLIRGRDVDAFTALSAIYFRAKGAPVGDRLPSHDAAEVLYQLSRRDLGLERWARQDSIDVLRRVHAAGRLTDDEAKVVRTRLRIADAHPDLF